MLQYVPWDDFDQRHIVWLANSLLACPADIRLSEHEILDDVRLGKKRLFEWPKGMVLVGTRDNRLVLWGFGSAPGLSMEECRLLATDLKRLAADWQCDTIETLCFDTRFASVITHLGGRVESMTLVLDVEPEDGR